MARRPAHATLSDGVWLRVRPLISRAKGNPIGGRPRLDDRIVLDGILYVLRTGIAWHRVPRELGFGTGMTLWRRHREWIVAGVWDRIRPILRQVLERDVGIDWSKTEARAMATPKRRRSRRPALDDER
jgi:transposase